MELRMVSLFPESTTRELDQRFGERFRSMPELDRLALVAAATEQTINHPRLREICADHSADISKALTNLVRGGFLDSDGSGRGMVYFLPGTTFPRLDEAFGEVGQQAGVPQANSGGLAGSSGGLGENSGGLVDSSGGLLAALKNRLLGRFPDGTVPGKLPREQMRDVVLTLCRGHYVPLKVLAEALGRSEDALRKDHLNPLVADRLLERQYPTQPNHPGQAYRTVE
jgi:hypothetical protein